MSSQINTPVGIPSELNFSLPSSMVPSRKFELRVQPYGQSTFNTSGQAIRLSLPQMQRTLYNFQTAYLMGTITFTQNGGVVGTDVSYLLGSWYSLFSRQVVRAGSGYVLETIDNPGQLVNAITSMTMNAAERISLNNSFGFSNTSGFSNLGVKINTTTTANDIGGVAGSERSFSFAIPLIGILNNTKLFPSFVGDMEIELTLADISRYIASVSANGVNGFTLSNVEFVTECLELAPEAYNMIMAQNPDKVVLKTQTYTYGSSSLPANQSVDIPFQIKVNSMKQLIWYAQPADAAEKTFAGVNPNLENWQFIVNGISYPQRPVQAKYPSEAFLQNQKAFGSVYSTSHAAGASRTEFNTASTVYGNPSLHRPYNTTVTVAALETNGRANKWYQCLDLETINSNKESLYSGISTNGTTSTLRLNINSALANAVHNIHYWSCQDVMVVMDMVSGITSVVQ